MKLEQLLQQKEALEPETIRMLFPKLNDLEIEKVFALITLMKTRWFWEDFYIFENIVLALNGIQPDFRKMEGASPEQIWYATRIARQLFPKREFSWEIQKYVEKLSNDAGYYIYPEAMDELDNNLLSQAIVRAKKTEPLTDNTTLEIQAGKYLAIQMYIDKKRNEDFINQ